MATLHRVLRDCAREVVDHHCRSGDLSRWARDALQDTTLAIAFSEIEHGHTDLEDVTTTRFQLLDAIEVRYLG